jgi:N-acetylglucosamine-6-sulfatase
MGRFLLVLGAALVATAAQAAPPSFVVMMMDDATIGEVAQAMPKAKALIADQGHVFDQFIVNESLCSPSRSTFLTGMYSHNHGVVCNEGPNGGFQAFRSKGREQQTIAIQLKNAGYRTALIGKYLNGYGGSYIPPGWTRWVGEQGGTCDQGYEFHVNDQGVTRTFLKSGNTYCDDYLTQQAVDFITNSAGKPFFLFLAYSAPHPPNVPPRRYRDAFPGAQAPRTPDFNEADISDKPSFIQRPLMTDNDIAARDSIYRTELQAIRAVDDGVEKVVGALSSAGRLSNTYILFTSDNGEWAGNHRLGRGKTLGFETDIHLPLWVRGPTVVPGHDSRLVNNADIPPTILSLAQLPLPAWLDGRSFHRLIQGREPSGGWRNVEPIERYPVRSDDPWPGFHGVRTSGFAFWHWASGDDELYDLAADAYELQNRSGDPALAAVQSQLAALAATLATCAGQTCRFIERQPAP